MKSIVAAILLLAVLTSCDQLTDGIKDLFGIKKGEIIKDRKYGIVFIANGTYSGSSTYKIPALSNSFTGQLIDSLRTNGGGILWVTYIDNNSNDNETLQLEVNPIRNWYFSFPFYLYDM